MKSVLLIGLMLLSSCGYKSRNNELVGQAKKVVNQTPLICPDRSDADISLGVMRNGVGSMSTQDVWLTIANETDRTLLTEAAAKGLLVKVSYNVARVTFCSEDHIVTRVELVN